MRIPRPLIALVAILTLTALVLQVAPDEAPQIARTVALFALTADLVVLLAFLFGPRRG